MQVIEQQSSLCPDKSSFQLRNKQISVIDLKSSILNHMRLVTNSFNDEKEMKRGKFLQISIAMKNLKNYLIKFNLAERPNSKLSFETLN